MANKITVISLLNHSPEFSGPCKSRRGVQCSHKISLGNDSVKFVQSSLKFDAKPSKCCDPEPHSSFFARKSLKMHLDPKTKIMNYRDWNGMITNQAGGIRNGLGDGQQASR